MNAVLYRSRSTTDSRTNASCSTAVWVYTTKTSSQTSSWELGCGTNLAAPIIAGVYALAGNAYTVDWAAQIPYQHTGYLHDVTSGYNGSCGTIMCRAATGYDKGTSEALVDEADTVLATVLREKRAARGSFTELRTMPSWAPPRAGRTRSTRR